MSQAQSLLFWVSQFAEVQGKHDTLTDLNDGVALCELLHKFIPDHMTASKLQSITRETGDNRALKEDNIDQLVGCLIDMYLDDHQVKISSSSLFPSVSRVVDGDEEHLMRLLKLVVGAAVVCEDKEENIQQIMTFEDDQKHDIMAAIEDVVKVMDMATSRPTSAASLDQFDLNDAEGDVARYKAQAKEVNQKYELLRQEYDTLLLQLTENEQELASYRTQEANTSTLPSEETDKMRQELIQLTELLEHMERQQTLDKQDHESRIADYERAMGQMKRQMEKALAEATEAEELRDEIIDLRSQAEQVPMLEDRIETLTRKLESAAEWNQHKEQLLTEVAQQHQTILTYENQIKQLKVEAENAEKLRIKVSELEGQVDESNRRGDKAEAELKATLNQMQRMKTEKEKLLQKQRALQAKIDDSIGGGSSSPGSASADVKKIAELEHEVEFLRKQLGETSENALIEGFKQQLEELRVKKDATDEENRKQEKKIFELEAELKHLTSNEGPSISDKVYEDMATLERNLSKSQAELDETKTRCEKLTAELESTQSELIELKKKQSLVGLEQKEMVEQARTEALADVESKIAELEKLKESFAKAKEEVENITTERNELRQKNSEYLNRVTQVLTEKDELSTKFNSLSAKVTEAEKRAVHAESLVKDKEREVAEVRGKLDTARHDFKQQRNVLEQVATTDDASSRVGDLEMQVAKLKKDLETAKTRYSNLKQGFEREEKLLATAWHDMTIQYQRKSMLERNSQRAGGSFLSRQRQSAMASNNR